MDVFEVRSRFLLLLFVLDLVSVVVGILLNLLKETLDLEQLGSLEQPEDYHTCDFNPKTALKSCKCSQNFTHFCSFSCSTATSPEYMKSTSSFISVYLIWLRTTVGWSEGFSLRMSSK